MKKDIYIIKNRINNKVYIGQTVNPTQRWNQYKCEAKKRPENQLITKAMRCYGIDSFWMEILEHNVENYDEKEIYWIKHYNSIAPNGYNLAPGGNGSGAGTQSVNAKIRDEKILFSVIDDIMMDTKPLREIAKKYNLSYGIINEINNGHTYFNPDLNYPLRKSKKYSEDKLKQITYSLRYELDKSMVDIAREYECDKSFLNDINLGTAYFREYLHYPLRVGKMLYQKEYLPLLINDLLNTNLSQKELAKKYNISQQTVSEVNIGKKGHQDNITYPIRANYQNKRSCFTPNEVQLIIQDLKNINLSVKQIAKKYGTTPSVITNINSGRTKKYYNEKMIYPIRK